MYDTDNDKSDQKISRLLTFAIGAEEYALGIEWIMEIVSIQKITQVPQMPPYVKGIINLRGNVLPVIDARLRFSMEERAYDERTCIVVVRIGQHMSGLIVDAVRDVSDIPTDNIDESGMATSGRNHFVNGIAKVGDEVKILLNAPALFDLPTSEEAAVEDAPAAEFGKVA